MNAHVVELLCAYISEMYRHDLGVRREESGDKPGRKAAVRPPK